MLLARVADAVYWAGRYLERVEDMSRIVQVHGDTHVDLPVGLDVGWTPLLTLAGITREQAQRHERCGSDAGTFDALHGEPKEAAVISLVVTDRDNPASILSSLSSARDNLRVARPVVPSEMWELTNELWFTLSSDAHQIQTRDGRIHWLRRAIEGCQRMNGVLSNSMRRDEAMAFIAIGQNLERADITCRMLDVRAESAAPTGRRDPYDEVHWMSLLRSLAAYQPFRRAMPAHADDGSTVRFLLQDETFPRAVSSCLSELRSILKRLPGNEDVLAACTDAAVMVADAPVDVITADGLRSLVRRLQPAIGTVAERLDAAYFHPEPSRAGAPTGWRRPMQTIPTYAMGSGTRRRDSDRIDGVTSSRTYRITHRTTYEYAGPVEQSYNEAHLRPRHTDRQHCESHQMTVEPEPVSGSEYVDAFGNAVSTFVVKGGFERMSVTTTSVVTVGAAPPPPPSLPWEAAQLLLEIDRQPAAHDARRYRAASRLVPAMEDLEKYALSSFPRGRPLVEAVVDLAERIHLDFVYEPGFTSVTTPLSDVFCYRRGVCQDFAHLAIGCLRSMDLAARYVSGYLETIPPPGQEKLVGIDASHAWLSVYVPGWGWVDVDPTNNQLASNQYITTAWGRDYWDVSPLRGSVEGGGESHTLDVAVDVVRLVTSSNTSP